MKKKKPIELTESDLLNKFTEYLDFFVSDSPTNEILKWRQSLINGERVDCIERERNLANDFLEYMNNNTLSFSTLKFIIKKITSPKMIKSKWSLYVSPNQICNYEMEYKNNFFKSKELLMLRKNPKQTKQLRLFLLLVITKMGKENALKYFEENPLDFLKLFLLSPLFTYFEEKEISKIMSKIKDNSIRLNFNKKSLFYLGTSESKKSLLVKKELLKKIKKESLMKILKDASVLSFERGKDHHINSFWFIQEILTINNNFDNWISFYHWNHFLNIRKEKINDFEVPFLISLNENKLFIYVNKNTLNEMNIDKSIYLSEKKSGIMSAFNDKCKDLNIEVVYSYANIKCYFDDQISGNLIGFKDLQYKIENINSENSTHILKNKKIAVSIYELKRLLSKAIHKLTPTKLDIFNFLLSLFLLPYTCLIISIQKLKNLKKERKEFYKKQYIKSRLKRDLK